VGFVTQGVLEAAFGPAPAAGRGGEKTALLCGPPGMMTAVGKALDAMGWGEGERFSF